MSLQSASSRQRMRGFTLIEIMVGVAIGMLGLIVVMQIASLSEGQKRSTTGSGDAQTGGAIAMFGLQGDVRLGGYGISEQRLIGCNVLLRAGVTLNAMAPATINHASIPAGDPNTDTLLVAYGNANGSSQGDGIATQPATNSYSVQAPMAFSGNDRVIAVPAIRATPCNLILDSVATIVGPNVGVVTGVAPMSGGTLFNMGQVPRVQVYAVRNGNLTVCDYMANDCGAVGNVASTTVWTPIANNIVSLRAQYGRDTTAPTMDAIVDTYDQTTPTTACGWGRVSAIRVVLVARNAQYEKTAVTAAAPVWEGSTADTTNTPTNPTAVPIDLTLSPGGAANPDWQNHRYKVFQTVIPLRNVAWLGVQTGC